VKVSEYGGSIYNVAPIKVVDPDRDVGPTNATPTAGMRYVSVLFRITAIAADTVIGGEPGLLGTDNQSYDFSQDAVITSSAGPSLVEAEVKAQSLSAGQTITGVAIYDMPLGVRASVIHWDWSDPRW
jgi:hypothetical protein